jgi:hypothetical protein
MRRHGLFSLLMAGESADVDTEKTEDFIVNFLPGLIEGYTEEDIYNADGTGLFFKCLPNKTYGLSNEKCHGGEKSKDRLTVMEWNMVFFCAIGLKNREKLSFFRTLSSWGQ